MASQEKMSVPEVINSSSSSNGFITVNLDESDTEAEERAQPTSEGKSKRGKERRLSRSAEASDPRDVAVEESLIHSGNSASTEPSSSSETARPAPHQELPPSDLSPTTFSPEAQTSHLDHLEVVPVSPHGILPQRTSSISFHNIKPSVTSTIFSFLMTVAFVCILWLVVFMVFGYRGHTIAGVFVGLFLIGLLINTCFLKLYFRLKVFLGLNAALAAAERHSAAMQRHRMHQDQITTEKASEKPPSYASAMAIPPPYNTLQYYRQKKSSASLNSMATSRASFYRKGHNCPFCKTEVKIFGICISCKNSLAKK